MSCRGKEKPVISQVPIHHPQVPGTRAQARPLPPRQVVSGTETSRLWDRGKINGAGAGAQSWLLP